MTDFTNTVNADKIREDVAKAQEAEKAQVDYLNQLLADLSANPAVSDIKVTEGNDEQPAQ